VPRVAVAEDDGRKQGRVELLAVGVSFLLAVRPAVVDAEDVVVGPGRWEADGADGLCLGIKRVVSGDYVQGGCVWGLRSLRIKKTVASGD